MSNPLQPVYILPKITERPITPLKYINENKFENKIINEYSKFKKIYS